MEESHRCRRLGSSGERNAEEHVPRNGHRRNGKIQEWEWVQRTRRRAHQELRTAGLKGLYARALGRLQM